MIKALTEGKETIDIMAAGTAMRFLTAYLSVTPGERTITGTARMQQRPIQILVNALRELGAEIEYVHNEGYPPLCIKGAELKGNEITLKGNVSSQYISALLMIGPALKDGLTLHLSGEIISRPLTLFFEPVKVFSIFPFFGIVVIQVFHSVLVRLRVRPYIVILRSLGLFLFLVHIQFLFQFCLGIVFHVLLL